jgi:hypothetical protein
MGAVFTKVGILEEFNFKYIDLNDLFDWPKEVVACVECCQEVKLGKGYFERDNFLLSEQTNNFCGWVEGRAYCMLRM